MIGELTNLILVIGELWGVYTPHVMLEGTARVISGEGLVSRGDKGGHRATFLGRVVVTIDSDDHHITKLQQQATETRYGQLYWTGQT